MSHYGRAFDMKRSSGGPKAELEAKEGKKEGEAGKTDLLPPGIRRSIDLCL